MKLAERDNQSALKDTRGQLIILRAQKLASAVYLITKFMSDEDPLKWQLRKLSLTVSSIIDQVDLSATLDPIRQMVALIDIALHGQAVSQMNFAIIKQEYLALRSNIISEQSKYNPLHQLPTPQLYQSAPTTRSALAPAPTLPTINHKTGFQPSASDSQRRQQIIKYIRDKGWSSIRDIASAVPNFSSKTVQRELIDLVRTGVLKKEGERRWSRYQLAEA